MRISLTLLALLGCFFMLFGQSTPLINISRGGDIPIRSVGGVGSAAMSNGNFAALAYQTSASGLDLDLTLLEIDGITAEVVNTVMVEMDEDQSPTHIFRAENGNIWIVGTTQNLTADNFQDIFVLEVDAANLSTVNYYTINENVYENIWYAGQSGENTMSFLRKSGDTFVYEGFYSLLTISMIDGSIVSEIELPQLTASSSTIGQYFIQGADGQTALVLNFEVSNDVIYGLDVTDGTIDFSVEMPEVDCQAGFPASQLGINGFFKEDEAVYTLATNCDVVYEVGLDGTVNTFQIADYPNFTFSFRSYVQQDENGFSILSLFQSLKINQEMDGSYVSEEIETFNINVPNSPNAPLVNGRYVSVAENGSFIALVNYPDRSTIEITALSEIITNGSSSRFRDIAVDEDRVVVTEQLLGTANVLVYNREGGLLNSFEILPEENEFGLSIDGIYLGENDQIYTTAYVQTGSNENIIKLIRIDPNNGTAVTYASITRPVLIFGTFGSVDFDVNGNVFLEYIYQDQNTFLLVQAITAVDAAGNILYDNILEDVFSLFRKEQIVADAAGNAYIGFEGSPGNRLLSYDIDGNLRYDVFVEQTILNGTIEPYYLSLNADDSRLLISGDGVEEGGTRSAYALEVDTDNGALIGQHLLNDDLVSFRSVRATYQAGNNNIIGFSTAFLGDEVAVDESFALNMSVIDESGEQIFERNYFNGFFGVPTMEDVMVSEDFIAYGAGTRFSQELNARLGNWIGINIDEVVSVKEVADLATTANLKAFPNPTKDLTRLSWDNQAASTYELSLLTQDGRLISRWQGDITAGRASVELTLSELPQGTYLARLVTPEGVSTQKIVKQ